MDLDIERLMCAGSVLYSNDLFPDEAQHSMAKAPLLRLVFVPAGGLMCPCRNHHPH